MSGNGYQRPRFGLSSGWTLLLRGGLWGGLWMLLGVLAPLAHAQTQPLGLEGAEFTALSGDRVQVVLSLSGPPPRPVSFTIDNPARVALDLPGVANRLERKTQTIGIGVARSMASAEAKGRTRVVLNLVEMVPYVTRVEGNEVVVVLDGTGSGMSMTAPPTPAEQAPAPVTTAKKRARSGVRQVENVDFRRGENGEGRVEVTLSDPSMPVDMSTEGDSVVLTLLDAALPAELERRLDVVDFATPVRSVETTARGNQVRVVVAASGNFDHFAYQSDNRYVVEVKPFTATEEEAKKKKFGYTGERLSLNFQDIEVRSVLQLIAEFTGFNIVVADTVSGSVTLRLNNVPWDQAMDIILQSKGLAMRQEGNVIMVAPASDIAAQERQELEAQNQNQALAPLRSEFIQVNYARASDIMGLLRSEGVSLLSDRGNISVDERTNTLLVQDTADSIADIRRLVTRLDVAVRQVMIESRIVVADDTFSKDLGVRFGATKLAERGDGLTALTGSAAGADTMIGSAVDNMTSTGSFYPITMPSQADRYNVNLPVTGAGQFGLAILGADYLLDMELQAMQNEGKGEVLSNPRVITGNNQTATISQGQTIQFLAITADGASVQPINANLSLAVTPQVTPDDHVLMSLTITDDSADSISSTVAVTNNRSITTNVLVADGETLVLGGIYQESRRHGTTKVPLLGDLPGLGALFRSKTRSNTKQELLVFVTPRILREGLTLK
ncbi:type IV pilus secretin PilQ [Endothiovibrio diazotrophicus]